MATLYSMRKEITKSQYEYLELCTYNEMNDFILQIANNSLFPPCAYGYYSPDFFKDDDKYYVAWDHYDSCD